MQIPVLVESMAPGGFRARSGEPLPLSAEGATREDAVNRLFSLYDERLASGNEIVGMDLPNGTQKLMGSNPWLAMLGIFKDDPMWDEIQQAIAENRRRIDEDPNEL